LARFQRSGVAPTCLATAGASFTSPEHGAATDLSPRWNRPAQERDDPTKCIEIIQDFDRLARSA